MTQRRQVEFHDEPMVSAREAPASETMSHFESCKNPGHIAAYCSCPDFYSPLDYKSSNFKGEVEVIIIKKLIYDCLLWLDIAFKLADINEYLDKIEVALWGETPNVGKKVKPPLKAAEELPKPSVC